MIEIIKLMLGNFAALTMSGIILIIVGVVMLAPIGLIVLLIASLCGCFHRKPTQGRVNKS